MDRWFGWPISVNWIIAPHILSFRSFCLPYFSPCLSSRSLPSHALSSFLCYLFPVTNQISYAPYRFCPLWVCMNGENGGREGCLLVCVRLSCSYQMFFFVLFLWALHCLPVTVRYTARVCVSVCVSEKEWSRAFVYLLEGGYVCLWDELLPHKLLILTVWWRACWMNNE